MTLLVFHYTDMYTKYDHCISVYNVYYSTKYRCKYYFSLSCKVGRQLFLFLKENVSSNTKGT